MLYVVGSVLACISRACLPPTPRSISHHFIPRYLPRVRENGYLLLHRTRALYNERIIMLDEWMDGTMVGFEIYRTIYSHVYRGLHRRIASATRLLRLEVHIESGCVLHAEAGQ